jgi:hypothetical protein
MGMMQAKVKQREVREEGENGRRTASNAVDELSDEHTSPSASEAIETYSCYSRRFTDRRRLSTDEDFGRDEAGKEEQGGSGLRWRGDLGHS